MPTLTCHCGQIRIEAAKTPDYINACNCSLCRKAGARWAYYHPDEVSVTGATRGYCRTDKAEAGAEIHFCPACGATTHFVLTPSTIAKFGNSLMGVNMALGDERDLAGIEERYPDGLAWAGEGDFTYVRAARIIGQETAGA